jgi:hypothetical protein
MRYPIEKSGQIGGFVQYMIYDIVSVHKFPRCSKILPRNVAFQLCRKKELHKLPVFLHPITVAQHVTRHQCTTKHHPHDAGFGLLQEEAGEEEEELSWVT